MHRPPFAPALLAQAPLALAKAVLTQDAGPLLTLTRAALDTGDREAAVWLACRAGALAPDEAWPWTVLATLSPETRALVHARRAYRLVPENTAILRQLGAGLEAAADAGGAERARRLLLMRDPADAPSLAAFMLARRRLGDAAAAAGLARAVRLEPGLAEASYTLGGMLAADGEPAAAAAIFASLAPVAPPQPGMTLPTAWPLDLVAAVKAGASLSSVMIPDPDLPQNAPEYVEHYVFDHVVLSERCLWALPQPFDVDPRGPGFTAFAYCGDPRIFARYWASAGLQAGSPVTFCSYPGDAYAFFRFVTRPDHALVYDSARPARTADLDEAIRAGRPLRLVLEAEDGLTHVLPVNLCFLYRESGAVRVTTETRYAPEFCLHPAEALWPYYAHLIGRGDTLKAPARPMPGGPMSGQPASDPPAGQEGAGKTDADHRHVAMLKAQSRLLIRRLTVHSDRRYEFFDAEGVPATATCRAFRLYRAMAPR